MNTTQDLLDQLWDDYATLNPRARAIYDLLVSKGQSVVNDHIALRTFGHPKVNVDVIAKAFTEVGYQPKEEYEFTEKHLFARHYEHSDAALPKVFISQLKLEAFSQSLIDTIENLVQQMSDDWVQRQDLPVSGRPWTVSHRDYEHLGKESEYAAWVAAWGFRVNHFTVFVNCLKDFNNLTALNQFIKDAGYEMNASGGEIKGSPEVFLEQSSTLAEQVEVEFSDRRHTIPCCYYEFARRYPLPNGQLFQGFVARSADKIFESTNRR